MPDLPVIIAHRGASANAPENTLEAFDLAWKQGADAVEGDFHMTADRQIVCHHDTGIATDVGGSVKISDISCADLKTLAKGRTIPTLADVLERIPPGKGFFIEVKCGPEIIDNLIDAVNHSTLPLDRLTVISFNREVISGIRERAPWIKTNWLVDLRQNLFRIRPGAATIVTSLKELECDGVGLRAVSLLSQRFISTIKSAGFSVHVWTVDSKSSAVKLARIGVDSITTNCPAKLRSFLNNHLQTG